MKLRLFSIGLILLSGLAPFTAAFVAPSASNLASLYRQQQRRQQRQQQHASPQTTLKMSSQFDVSNPVFDLFSFKNVRGDALAKYNALNQSEPLRINVWGLLALTFYGSPWLSEELNGETQPLLNTGLAILAGTGCVGLFLRECQRRSRQLSRLEKELNALSLEIRMPSNKIADANFQKAESLKSLVNTSSRTVRVIAVSGTEEQLKESLLPLRALGRRLVQSSTYVVVVPTDGSRPEDYGIRTNERLAWLTEAAYPEQWQEYFENISPENSSDEFRWFGISAVGRSFGSGKGTSPEWLQILGQHLRPTDILDESDPPQEDTDGVLAVQNRFYKALTEGNLDEMKTLFSKQEAAKVSTVIGSGGRMDEWKVCLEDGARPAGMKQADADVFVVSENLAYSTVVEFPVTAGMEDATLLAVQTWERGNAKEDWKLRLHQTIPWTADRPAGGTLLCDCRGCVALTRGPDKRTFGGLIG